MDEKVKEVSLANLANGAAVELFDRQFGKLLENIADPNTDAQTKRIVSVEVTVTPTEDRETGHVAVAVKSKLAPPRPAPGTIHLGERHGKPVAVTYDLRQQDFFVEQDEDIRPIDREEATR